MSRSFKLFRLQQADSKMDAATARLRQIEELLSNDQVLRQAEKKFGQAEQALQVAHKDLKRAEQLTQQQRLKIKQNSDRLYSGTVKNPKELEDLQHEGQALQRYLEVLEEQQLEAMLVVDDTGDDFGVQQQSLEKVRAERIEAHAALNGEKTKLTADVKRFSAEREAIAVTIDAEDLRVYEKLRAKLGGIALAAVSNQSCGACGTLLNSALNQSSRASDRLANCETCGRILYGG